MANFACAKSISFEDKSVDIFSSVAKQRDLGQQFIFTNKLLPSNKKDRCFKKFLLAVIHLRNYVFKRR